MERKGVTLAVLVAISALGFGARCASFRGVFLPGEVDLVPADSHYYLRWARLQLHSPSWVREDRYLNFPEGALVIWPPLHTLFVEAFVAAAGGKDDLKRAEVAGAWVDPSLSLLWLLGLGVWLSRAWGRAAAWAGTWTLALAPLAIESGPLGCADHHLHEVFGAAAVALLAGEWLVRGGWRWAVAAGAGAAAMRLLSPLGLAFAPLVLLTGAVATFFEGKVRAVDLFWAGGAAALTAGLSALLWGEPARLDLELLGAFPLLLAVGGSGALALAVTLINRRRPSGWRVGAAGGVAALALVPLAAQLWRGAGQALGRDPILAMAEESSPLWNDPVWAYALLGALLLVAPLAVVGAVVLARREVRALGAVVPLLVFLPLAAGQARFAYPALGFLAVVLWPGLRALEQAWLGGRQRWSRALSGASVVALATLVLQVQFSEPAPGLARHLRPAIEWLKANTPAPSPSPWSAEQPAWGVLSNHLAGHLILLWGERPVMASTFGQASWHRKANAEATAILAQHDVAKAVAEAKAQHLRYLLVYRHMPLLGVPEAEAEQSAARQLVAGVTVPGAVTRYDADGVKIIELE